MTPYELMKKVGGETVRGQLRYREGGSGPIVVIAQLNGDEMVFTAEGRELAREYDTVPAKRPGRPKKTTAKAAPIIEPVPQPELAFGYRDKGVTDG